MFQLKNANIIIKYAPKYSKIVEPFGDSGSIAFEMAKKKPKQHILNIEDEMMFNLLIFIQNISSSDKSALKSKDWTSSQETFNKALSITAVDGAEYYYRWMYLKEFGVSDMKDMAADPVYDWTTTGDNIKNKLYELPVMTVSLKGVTIINEEPISVLSQASGADSYLILKPKKPEHIAAIDARINGIKTPFIYIKKNTGNDSLIASIKGTQNKISIISSGSVMPGRAEVMTNYDNKLIPVDITLAV